MAPGVYSVAVPKEAEMADLIYVSVLIAFFAVAGLFVVACDKIIGPDEEALREGLTGTPEPQAETKRAAA
jgi:hypothetical protein